MSSLVKGWEGRVKLYTTFGQYTGSGQSLLQIEERSTSTNLAVRFKLQGRTIKCAPSPSHCKTPRITSRPITHTTSAVRASVVASVLLNTTSYNLCHHPKSRRSRQQPRSSALHITYTLGAHRRTRQHFVRNVGNFLMRTSEPAYMLPLLSPPTQLGGSRCRS
jgi:hypothetical protein